MKRPRIVSAATRAFWEAGRRTPGFGLSDFVHGYVYGRWTYLYIALGTGQHPLARAYRRLMRRLPRRPRSQAAERRPGFEQGYHGKVVPLAAARQLVSVNEPIRRPDLERVIPYDRARALILERPDALVALDCPCRSARPNPCLPLDVCLIVGEPFAGFVLEHHRDHARPITRQEALTLLEAEDARGHVHHAFFKDAMLGRFYAICNCCSCCCGAIQSHQHGTPMLASSGYVSQVDEAACIGCGECLPFCAFGALSVASFAAEVDPQRCLGCGLCASHCQQGALSLQRDPHQPPPLEL